MEITLWIVGIILVYLISSVITYVIMKHDWIRIGCRWTRGTRKMVVVLSLLSPIMLVVALVTAFGWLLDRWEDDNDDASW